MSDKQTDSDAEYPALWTEYQAALRALRLVSINLSLVNSEGRDLGGYGKLAKDAVEAALKRAEDFKGMNSCDALRIVDGVPHDLYNKRLGQTTGRLTEMTPSEAKELNIDFEADGSEWRWVLVTVTGE